MIQRPSSRAVVHTPLFRHQSISEKAMEKSRYAFVILALAFLWNILPFRIFTSEPVKVEVDGYVHPAFSEVKEVFRKNFESGKERGASFSIYHKGEVLVDIWAGLVNPQTDERWQKDTLSQAWSCTKGMTAAILAMLIDRGHLNESEYVKTYWPEFAQNGKENITVDVLFSHRAGLLGVGKQISLQEYRDNWEEVEAGLARQKPAWEPGTWYSYHAYTFGMYADALIRKVDPQHRNISQFFKEELAIPFELDYHIGLPIDQNFRTTKAVYRNLLEIFATTILNRPNRWKWIPHTLFGKDTLESVSVVDIADDMSKMEDPEHRSIGLSSFVGFGTARSLAKFYDYLANNGSVAGRRLVSERRARLLSTSATDGVPVFVAPDEPFSALGMILSKGVLGQNIFGHGGYGGQAGLADPVYGLGVGYLSNFNSLYMDSVDPRAIDLLQAFFRGWDKYKATERD